MGCELSKERENIRYAQRFSLFRFSFSFSEFVGKIEKIKNTTLTVTEQRKKWKDQILRFTLLTFSSRLVQFLIFSGYSFHSMLLNFSLHFVSFSEYGCWSQFLHPFLFVCIFVQFSPTTFSSLKTMNCNAAIRVQIKPEHDHSKQK